MNPTGSLPGLSVFLPAYNEEGNIERVVKGFCAKLPSIAYNYEVVVVDDGSCDRTGEIVDRLAAADPHVKAIHHTVNRGYGGAVVSGIRASTQPYVLLCDGDGQFDPVDVALLAARMPAYDVAVGRRARRADRLIRRLNGKAWTMLVTLLFSLRVSDIDCGFKLFKREVLDGIDLRSQGALISTELMARIAGRGAKICEVDVRHLPRQKGEPTGGKVSIIVRSFRELFALFRELRAARHQRHAR